MEGIYTQGASMPPRGASTPGGGGSGTLAGGQLPLSKFGVGGWAPREQQGASGCRWPPRWAGRVEARSKGPIRLGGGDPSIPPAFAKHLNMTLDIQTLSSTFCTGQIWEPDYHNFDEHVRNLFHRRATELSWKRWRARKPSRVGVPRTQDQKVSYRLWYLQRSSDRASKSPGCQPKRCIFRQRRSGGLLISFLVLVNVLLDSNKVARALLEHKA